MIGILCEKPSAGRNFSTALGGMTGTYNGEQYQIVCSRGHLYELEKPEKQVKQPLTDTYKSWELDNLPWNEKDFQWKRAKKKDVSDLLRNIKSVLDKCDEVVIATDWDSSGEGELLAWEILDELAIRPKKFSRMKFNDESVKEIRRAFVNRYPIKDMQSDMEYVKADYRSKFDFLSMQFTRIATNCGDGKSVLRQGRLKSAMVLLVGDALTALKNYKAIPYYQNRFRDENGNVFTNPDEPTYPDKKDVPKVYTSSPVVLDSATMKHSSPPSLLDLADLSARLASKGIRANTVLKTYQKMYERQLLSYPRTDDKTITPDQFNEMLPLVDKIANLVGVDTKLLTHRTPRKTHVKTGGSHGANRPGSNVPSSLDALDSTYGPGAKLIYETLAHNFLAMFAEDYEYEAQKGHLQKYPDFVGSANVPKKMGWKLVFTDEDDANDTASKGLGNLAEPFVYEGFPPKPPTPTFTWLKNQLKKYDVGTGATRTSIYAEVTSTKAIYPLLVDKRGKISMTIYGEMSYMLLPGTHIGSLKITEDMQSDMREIAAGKLDPEVCLHKMQQMVKDDIEVMKKNSIIMRKELNVMDKSNSTEQKEKAEGVWKGKNIKFNRVWGDHRFTDDEVEALLAGEEIEILGLKSRSGKEYGIRGKLSQQSYNGHKFVGFERTGFANEKKVPDEWCKHKFTDDEKILLEQGKIVHIDGAISKKGNVFACDVKFGENEKGVFGIIPMFN